MNAKCIYSKTIEELIKSPQHFEDGTVAIIDDNKLDSFVDCIFAFRERTGLMLVNCAEHALKEEQISFED